jgi:acyl transferase domain-containing protein
MFAGVSDFGSGGTNTHLVLEQAPGTPDTQGDSRLRRFPIGAPDGSRLRDHAR